MFNNVGYLFKILTSLHMNASGLFASEGLVQNSGDFRTDV